MNAMSVGSNLRDALYAATGVGPLYQRDYVGVLEGACSPEDVATFVREHFVEIAPRETAAFERVDGSTRELEIGDELSIRIGGVLPCRVRVVQMDETCLTLRTLSGHPEAGRISFKADRDEHGRVTFHIRSRARSGRFFHYLGFLLMGRTMQARCWIRFIGRAAEAAGCRLDGPVRVSTTRVEQHDDDCCGPDRSTFDCHPES